MFCASCGTSLAAGSNFCHLCGTPVSAGGMQKQAADPFASKTGDPFASKSADPFAGKGAVPQKMAAAATVVCIQCKGAGKSHRSSMPHSAGCIFCETCPGCAGTGAIPSTACACPKCQGTGKAHDSMMPHNPPNCFFCSDCMTCQKKGWI